MSKLPGSPVLGDSLVCIVEQYRDQTFPCDAIGIDCGLPRITCDFSGSLDHNRLWSLRNRPGVAGVLSAWILAAICLGSPPLDRPAVYRRASSTDESRRGSTASPAKALQVRPAGKHFARIAARHGGGRGRWLLQHYGFHWHEIRNAVAEIR
jgi:hypothetical protein